MLENINIDDERTIIYVDWMKENIGCNLVRILDNIPERHKDKYPNYPIGNEYVSF